MVSKTAPVLEHARAKSARVPNTRSAAPMNCAADAETVIRPSPRFSSSTSRRKEASVARVTMQAPTVWTGAPEISACISANKRFSSETSTRRPAVWSACRNTATTLVMSDASAAVSSPFASA